MSQIVAIELEKPRRLKFDINALSDVEEALGLSLGAVMGTNLGIRTIRASPVGRAQVGGPGPDSGACRGTAPALP